MKRGGGVSGAVSLVMIFCVLCLAVFSVLTLVTADRERALAELTAERARSYYEADAQATEIVSAIRSGAPTDANITYSSDPTGETAFFTVPAGGEQVLEVRLGNRGGTWEVLSWKTVYGGSWELDETLELFDFDFF